MPATFIHTLLFAAAVAPHPGSAPGIFYADGILRTRGPIREHVVVSVIPEYSGAYQVRSNGKRFELQLPLHANYLLRVECPTCPTKEIVFDLRVPSAYDGQAFTFPLEVLMEQVEGAEVFRYAGPVGLVYFDEALEDFTYTTDHTRIHQRAPVVEHMHVKEGMEKRTSTASSDVPGYTGHDPLQEHLRRLLADAQDRPDALRHVRAGGRPVSDPDTAEPGPHATVVGLSNSSHGMDSHGAPAPAFETKMDDGSPEESVIAASTALVSTPAGAQVKVDATAGRGVGTPAVSSHRHMPNTEPDTPVASAAIERSALDCRGEDRQELPRCTVTIHWIRTPTGCKELRKAEHAYGAVFHFLDGQAVTDRTYQHALTHGW